MWKGCFDFNILMGARVFKSDDAGVQTLSLQQLPIQLGKCHGPGRGPGPIHRIAEQGMLDVRHVDADLVGAAGLQLALQVIETPI